VAVDALATVAAQFAAAAPDLRRLADGAAGLPDFHAPDAFFQTLAAAGACGGCMRVVGLLTTGLQFIRRCCCAHRHCIDPCSKRGVRSAQQCSAARTHMKG
jgi:hypothetical protein